MTTANSYYLGLKTFDADPIGPLDRLDDAELRMIYFNARAYLLRSLPPSAAALVRRGKCAGLILTRMRAMALASLEEHMYDPDSAWE